jgi:hypothetical protein
MSKFLQHKPCPHCRSRDNLAEYDDHFWCFGCGKFIPKDDLASVKSRYFQRSSPKITEDVNELDCIQEIPQEPLSWLLSYGLTLDEIRDNNISWCPSQEILVLINLGTYWQGRCFGNQKVKYLSKGIKPLLFYGYSDKIICVEDILSAIKLSRLSPEYCAMPLLGCSVSQETISRLSGKFSEVILWLDRDKAKEAVKISRDLKQRGFNSRVIISELDPKEYNEILLNNFLSN